MLLEKAGLPLDGHIDDLGRTLGEELLEPTRIYALDCLALANECEVRTFCHVTGGGLVGNMERIIPEGKVAEMHRATWSPAPIFRTIAEVGNVPVEEMEKTFNAGVGMVAIVAPEDRDRALAMLTARHVDCWELGVVRGATEEDGGHRATLVGTHAV